MQLLYLPTPLSHSTFSLHFNICFLSPSKSFFHSIFAALFSLTFSHISHFTFLLRLHLHLLERKFAPLFLSTYFLTFYPISFSFLYFSHFCPVAFPPYFLVSLAPLAFSPNSHSNLFLYLFSIFSFYFLSPLSLFILHSSFSPHLLFSTSSLHFLDLHSHFTFVLYSNPYSSPFYPPLFFSTSSHLLSPNFRLHFLPTFSLCFLFHCFTQLSLTSFTLLSTLHYILIPLSLHFLNLLSLCSF